jgi:drug/metabolite transporter (DMT)-like permease
VLGVSLAVLATVAVSLTTLSVRVGTADGGTFDALLVVLLTNAVVFVPLATVLYFPDFGITLRSVAAFFGAGVVATLIGRSLTFVSFRRIGASRTEPIRSAHPLTATLVAVVVLSEAVSLLRLFGIGLVVVGVAYISWEASQTDVAVLDDTSSWALLIPMGAAFFYGLEPTLAKIGLAEGTPPLVGLGIKTLAALGVLAVYLFVRGSLPDSDSLERLTGKWLLLAGVLNTTFMTLYYVALQVAPVTLVIPIIATSPLVVVVLSRLFLPRLERVSPRLVAGAVVVVVGAIAVTVSG